jgi:hypothetical protein
MADPVYLGVNELGIPVYEIEEGGMRPMVDRDGEVLCSHCGQSATPMRISLAPGKIKDVEWVLLCCPRCYARAPHCLMRVKLMRKRSTIPIADLTAFHPDPLHEIEVAPCSIEEPNA